jgi:hypothetical protein
MGRKALLSVKAPAKIIKYGKAQGGRGKEKAREGFGWVRETETHT